MSPMTERGIRILLVRFRPTCVSVAFPEDPTVMDWFVSLAFPVNMGNNNEDVYGLRREDNERNVRDAQHYIEKRHEKINNQH